MFVKMAKTLRTEGRNALFKDLQSFWVEVTGQVKGQHCNSRMGLHQTENPGRNQVLSATASAQEEGIEIHRWKASEKQEVEGDYPEKEMRKSCSALIRSFIISHRNIRMKLKLIF